MSVTDHFAHSPADSQGINPKPGPNPLPFVPLPRAALRDPRLTATDTALLAAILEVARNDVSCYPAVSTLAAVIKKYVRTVQYSLRRLVTAGWIRSVPDPTNATGRRLVLLWRSQPGLPVLPISPPVAPPVQAPAPPPVQPAAPNVRRDEDRRYVTRSSPCNPLARQSLASPPASPHASPLGPAPLTPESPHTAQSAPYPGPQASPLIDDLKAVPGAAPDFVRRTAFRLAAFLGDLGSAGYYLSILARVAGGEVDSLERLLAAYAAGSKAKGSARKPGAVFCWAFGNWVRPPKPSEIRYYQTPSSKSPVAVPVSAGSTDSTGPPAMTVAEEIAELRAILAQPRPSPFATSARRRLVELGADPGQ